MKKTIATLLLGTGVLLGATTTNVIKYRSIQVSDEAKVKVGELSKILKLSQRDTASLMIKEWGLDTKPFKDYTYKGDYKEMVCWLNKAEYDQYLDSRRKIAQGISVYEVVEGDRCINK